MKIYVGLNCWLTRLWRFDINLSDKSAALLSESDYKKVKTDQLPAEKICGGGVRYANGVVVTEVYGVRN
jgi:hypothetical protein